MEIMQIKAENCIKIYCQTHVIQDNGWHYGLTENNCYPIWQNCYPVWQNSV